MSEDRLRMLSRLVRGYEHAASTQPVGSKVRHYLTHDQYETYRAELDKLIKRTKK